MASHCFDQRWSITTPQKRAPSTAEPRRASPPPTSIWRGRRISTASFRAVCNRVLASSATWASVSPVSVSTSAGRMANTSRPATATVTMSPIDLTSMGPVTRASTNRSSTSCAATTRSLGCRPRSVARNCSIGRFAKVSVAGGPLATSVCATAAAARAISLFVGAGCARSMEVKAITNAITIPAIPHVRAQLPLGSVIEKAPVGLRWTGYRRRPPPPARAPPPPR